MSARDAVMTDSGVADVRSPYDGAIVSQVRLSPVDAALALVERALEGLQRLVDLVPLDEDLGGAAPDHHQALAVVLRAEVPDVRAQRLGPLALRGAGDDVRALEAFDVALVEGGRHRLDPLQEPGDRVEVAMAVETASLAS